MEKFREVLKAIDVKSICQNIKDFLNEFLQVNAIKFISKLLILIDLDDYFGQSINTNFTFFWRAMFQGPYNTLNQIFEGFFGYVEKNLKAELNHRLNKEEQIFPNFNKRCKVLRNHWKG